MNRRSPEERAEDIDIGIERIVDYVLKFRKKDDHYLKRFYKTELLTIAECPNHDWKYLRDGANEVLIADYKLALIQMQGKRAGFHLRRADNLALMIRNMKRQSDGCDNAALKMVGHLNAAGMIEETTEKLTELDEPPKRWGNSKVRLDIKKLLSPPKK